MIESLRQELALEAYNNPLPHECWKDAWVHPKALDILKKAYLLENFLSLAQHPKHGTIVVCRPDASNPLPKLLFCESEHVPLAEEFHMFPPQVSNVFKQTREHSKLANLYVHQYQVAATAMNHTPPDSIYRGLNCTAESEDAFYWKPTKPFTSELEQYARDLYAKAIEGQYNHADIHVAISALYQLGLLAGEEWDVKDIGSYAL